MHISQDNLSTLLVLLTEANSQIDLAQVSRAQGLLKRAIEQLENLSRSPKPVPGLMYVEDQKKDGQRFRGRALKELENGFWLFHTSEGVRVHRPQRLVLTPDDDVTQTLLFSQRVD